MIKLTWLFLFTSSEQQSLYLSRSLNRSGRIWTSTQAGTMPVSVFYRHAASKRITFSQILQNGGLLQVLIHRNSSTCLSLNIPHLVYNALGAKQLFSVSLKHKLKTTIPFSIQWNVFVLQWIISISTVAAATQAIISVHS